MPEIQAGVVGVGNMGSGIARNLIGAGFRTAVWDLSEKARNAFSPDAPAMPPPEMAAEGAVMFYVVPASPDIEDGFDEVLAATAPGTVIYDLTTSFPEDTRRLAARAAAAGLPYLDAAMSGGASGAEAGTLTLMVGGDEDAFARTRPCLDAFAGNIFFLGASGAGHAMKLVHNMVCHTNFLAVCEAGRLCEAAGLRLEDMIRVFNVSNARSYASERRFPDHVLSGKWDGRSRVHNLHKDLDMAVRLARSVGADRTLASDTLAFLEAAAALGMADLDFTLLYREFDRIRETAPSSEAASGTSQED